MIRITICLSSDNMYMPKTMLLYELYIFKSLFWLYCARCEVNHVYTVTFGFVDHVR